MNEREILKIKARIEKAEKLPKEELDKYRMQYEVLKAQLAQGENKEIEEKDTTLMAVVIMLGLGEKPDSDIEHVIYKGIITAFIDKMPMLGLGMINAGINEHARRKAAEKGRGER